MRETETGRKVERPVAMKKGNWCCWEREGKDQVGIRVLTERSWEGLVLNPRPGTKLEDIWNVESEPTTNLTVLCKP